MNRGDKIFVALLLLTILVVGYSAFQKQDNQTKVESVDEQLERIKSNL